MPSQQVHSLIFHISSITMTVTLPPEKIDNALTLSFEVLNKHQITIQLLVQLIGTYISVFPACPLGRSHYRSL